MMRIERVMLGVAVTSILVCAAMLILAAVWQLVSLVIA